PLTRVARFGRVGSEVSLMVPAHPGFDIRPGTYRIEIDSEQPVEATVTLKTGPVGPDLAQVVDLDVVSTVGGFADAAGRDELRAAVDRVLEPQNLGVGELQVTSASPGDGERFERFDLDVDPGPVCGLGDGSRRPRSLQVVLVGSFTGGSVGYSTGVPGAVGVPSAGATCVVIAAEDVPVDRLGATIAHEGAHFMGLTHPTEGDGTEGDDFDDTPVCDVATYDGRDGFGQEGVEDGLVTATECGVEGGADNVLFPEDAPPEARSILTQTELTDDQAWALRRHPLFRPVR
ncbi:MAG: hypothetical protein AAGK32_07750, partial [Actinomycetota bacterium]